MMTTESTTEVPSLSLAAFADRIASLLRRDLSAQGVCCFAEPEIEYCWGNAWGFDKIVSVRLFGTSRDGWSFNIERGLGIDSGTSQDPLPSITSLSSSEMANITRAWASEIAKVGQQIAFCNLYMPKAVAERHRYNDGQIAFRYVRAWDPVRALEIIRLDSAFKALGEVAK